MNPLELYQKVLNRRLNEPEMDQVEAWIRQYPYFTLPYFLKARQTKDKLTLFEASLHASNRFLLKRFMDGSIILQEQNFSEVIEERLKMSHRPFSMGENDMFSVVDFDAIHANSATKGIPFKHLDPSRGYIDNFLNCEVKVRTLKYLPLLDRIDSQIQRFRKKNKPDIPGSRKTSEKENQEKGKEVHSQVATSPVSEGGTANRDDWDQFLDDVPLLKNNLGKESPEPDLQVMASLDEDAEMVSETLAEIHLLQQNHEEAIRIYEKLSLLFPEKKAYFADQINLIKGE